MKKEGRKKCSKIRNIRKRKIFCQDSEKAEKKKDCSHGCGPLLAAELTQIDEPDAQADLDNQDQRHTDDEVPVPGLMVKDVHTCDGAGRAAQYGGEKQSFFRDPPEILFGFPFIQPHQEKSGQGDENKIYNYAMGKLQGLSMINI